MVADKRFKFAVLELWKGSEIGIECDIDLIDTISIKQFSPSISALIRSHCAVEVARCLEVAAAVGREPSNRDNNRRGSVHKRLNFKSSLSLLLKVGNNNTAATNPTGRRRRLSKRGLVDDGAMMAKNLMLIPIGLSGLSIVRWASVKPDAKLLERKFLRRLHRRATSFIPWLVSFSTLSTTADIAFGASGDAQDEVAKIADVVLKAQAKVNKVCATNMKVGTTPRTSAFRCEDIRGLGKLISNVLPSWGGAPANRGGSIRSHSLAAPSFLAGSLNNVAISKAVSVIPATIDATLSSTQGEFYVKLAKAVVESTPITLALANNPITLFSKIPVKMNIDGSSGIVALKGAPAVNILQNINPVVRCSTRELSVNVSFGKANEERDIARFLVHGENSNAPLRSEGNNDVKLDSGIRLGGVILGRISFFLKSKKDRTLTGYKVKPFDNVKYQKRTAGD
ncbi:hypothetical protein BJ742DRAFT_743286 [Cladochytrium replicatum]|nr:hypothetical protein BJ742DRAFT_743286 [Cladochytrium replicatum]